MSRPGERCLPALDALAHAAAERALQAVRDDAAQAAWPPQNTTLAPQPRPTQESARTPDADGAHGANRMPQAAWTPKPLPPLWALDATAGNGHDTLFLARSLTACAGRLLAVDIQPQALERSAARLTEAGFDWQRLEMHDLDSAAPDAPATALTVPPSSDTLTESRPSVTVSAPVLLLLADHAMLDTVLKTLAIEGKLAVALFNLGFLPGSDKRRVTTAAGTLAALEAVETALAPGGLISLHLYTGHPGGEDEAEAVLEHAARLPRAEWRVLRLSQHNKPRAAEHLLLLEHWPPRLDRGLFVPS